MGLTSFNVPISNAGLNLVEQLSCNESNYVEMINFKNQQNKVFLSKTVRLPIDYFP